MSTRLALVVAGLLLVAWAFPPLGGLLVLNGGVFSRVHPAALFQRNSAASTSANAKVAARIGGKIGTGISPAYKPAARRVFLVMIDGFSMHTMMPLVQRATETSQDDTKHGEGSTNGNERRITTSGSKLHANRRKKSKMGKIIEGTKTTIPKKQKKGSKNRKQEKKKKEKKKTEKKTPRKKKIEREKKKIAKHETASKNSGVSQNQGNNSKLGTQKIPQGSRSRSSWSDLQQVDAAKSAAKLPAEILTKEMQDVSWLTAPFMWQVISELGVWGFSEVRPPTESQPAMVATLSSQYQLGNNLFPSGHAQEYQQPSSLEVRFLQKSRPRRRETGSIPDTIFDRVPKSFSFWTRYFGIAREIVIGAPGGVPVMTQGGFLSHCMGPDEIAFDLLNSVLETFPYKNDPEPTLWYLQLTGPDCAANGVMAARATQTADRILQLLHDSVQKQFPDQESAFVVVGDHGVIDQRHGWGHFLMTHVPFLSWGAGIAKPQPSSHFIPQQSCPSRSGIPPFNGLGVVEALSINISRFARRDIDQLDIVCLVSSLLGVDPVIGAMGRPPLSLTTYNAEERSAIRLVQLESRLEFARGIANELLERQARSVIFPMTFSMLSWLWGTGSFDYPCDSKEPGDQATDMTTVHSFDDAEDRMSRIYSLHRSGKFGDAEQSSSDLDMHLLALVDRLLRVDRPIWLASYFTCSWLLSICLFFVSNHYGAEIFATASRKFHESCKVGPIPMYSIAVGAVALVSGWIVVSQNFGWLPEGVVICVLPTILTWIVCRFCIVPLWSAARAESICLEFGTLPLIAVVFVLCPLVVYACVHRSIWFVLLFIESVRVLLNGFTDRRLLHSKRPLVASAAALISCFISFTSQDNPVFQAGAFQPLIPGFCAGLVCIWCLSFGFRHSSRWIATLFASFMAISCILIVQADLFGDTIATWALGLILCTVMSALCIRHPVDRTEGFFVAIDIFIVFVSLEAEALFVFMIFLLSQHDGDHLEWNKRQTGTDFRQRAAFRPGRALRVAMLFHASVFGIHRLTSSQHLDRRQPMNIKIVLDPSQSSSEASIYSVYVLYLTLPSLVVLLPQIAFRMASSSIALDESIARGHPKEKDNTPLRQKLLAFCRCTNIVYNMKSGLNWREICFWTACTLPCSAVALVLTPSVLDRGGVPWILRGEAIAIFVMYAVAPICLCALSVICVFMLGIPFTSACFSRWNTKRNLKKVFQN